MSLLANLLGKDAEATKKKRADKLARIKDKREKRTQRKKETRARTAQRRSGSAKPAETKEKKTEK